MYKYTTWSLVIADMPSVIVSGLCLCNKYLSRKFEIRCRLCTPLNEFRSVKYCSSEEQTRSTSEIDYISFKMNAF